MLQEAPLSLSPGQSRPLGFNVAFSTYKSPRISLRLTFVVRGTDEVLHSPIFSTSLSLRDITEPHRITFLHPAGIVSYAILIAPDLTSFPRNTNDQKLPVLLSMHGAGLEADSEEVRHMLDSALGLPAWIVFPTGVTPWSGDDWRMFTKTSHSWPRNLQYTDTWGYADVQAAIAAIPHWIEEMSWTGPYVEMKKVLVSGHSNGGRQWMVCPQAKPMLRPDRTRSMVCLNPSPRLYHSSCSGFWLLFYSKLV